MPKSLLITLLLLSAFPICGQTPNDSKLEHLLTHQGVLVPINNAQDMFDKGYRYHKGIRCPKDHVKAARCYRQAAEQGNWLAQLFLGELYYNGEGVKQDFNQAFHWFFKSAQQGHPIAQYHVGCCYFNGEGVKKNRKKAIYWWQKSNTSEAKDSLAKYQSTTTKKVF